MVINRSELLERRSYWKSIYDETKAAYFALLQGRVQSYTINDRQLSRLDLGQLRKAMHDAEKKIDEIDDLLSGGSSRKAVGIVPRDW